MSTPYITLIVAPEIPTSECDPLKKHWQEAEEDPDYAVVVNYECRVDQVEVPDGHKILVVAPGIPLEDLKKLREQLNTALDADEQSDRVVVCNYECRIDVIYNYDEEND
jgi:hypothetical protein